MIITITPSTCHRRNGQPLGTQPICAGGTDEPWLGGEPPSLVLDSRALSLLLRQTPVVHYRAAMGPARHAGSNRPFTDQGACAAGSVNSSQMVFSGDLAAASPSVGSRAGRSHRR